MKKVTYSLLSCAFLAMTSSACAAENDTNPPEVEASAAIEAPAKKSFNFNIPSEEAPAPSGGFNFNTSDDTEVGTTALGRVEIPVDADTKIETFEPTIEIPQ